MSRIGKLPIIVPAQVEVSLDGPLIKVTGPYGNLSRTIPGLINVSMNEREILVFPIDNSRKARELHGLVRTLINNMVIGVSSKYQQKLEIKGVGYRSQVQKNNLVLNLGYSHPVILSIPLGIEVSIEANVNILIQGIDNELVGQFAATIRSKRPPEPYKGKGILYKGEVIKRKVGKSGK